MWELGWTWHLGQWDIDLDIYLGGYDWTSKIGFRRKRRSSPIPALNWRGWRGSIAEMDACFGPLAVALSFWRD